ncbi:YetF domain-containing protein [Ornithinimicrobium pekingense]|uniref:DUF421 domain-containing protein n=1 Tax=Ornithinimicrobium pekingense TaxID=384677 RepID=A0ABQ2F9Y3_9MICO|nr:YetF domain-containing protein [Ornithinimicrobium pekingense]GGK76035.1 DUF421 domain-containing protein [Ornithinimicrobium pekingense]
MQDLWYHLGITPAGAVGVVVSTLTMYFVFGAVLRLWGQRLYSSPRSVDLAVVTVLGAIVGRSTMGHVPTLAGGLLALGTLGAIEVAFHGLRRLPIPQLRRPTPRARAVVLAVAGKVRTEALHTYGLTMPMLWSAMRQAGVSHPSQVALAVLEPQGRISVLRTGQPIHPRALMGVKGSHTVMQQLREAGHLHTAPLSTDETGGPSGGSAPVPVPPTQAVGGQAGQHDG